MAVSGVGKIAEAKTTISIVKGLACSRSETGNPGVARVITGSA